MLKITSLIIFFVIELNGVNLDASKVFRRSVVKIHEASPKVENLKMLGSGFIFNNKGNVVTANHVVKNIIHVKVFPGSFDAYVVGRDPELDLALLEIKGFKDLNPAVLGDSDKLQKGQQVFTVGNRLIFNHTITEISKGTVQIDSNTSSFDKGGPLFNDKGEVIALNNSVKLGPMGKNCSVLINSVKKVMPDLLKNGFVKRGYIGVGTRPLSEEVKLLKKISPNVRGVIVSTVKKGTTAHKSGLMLDDVITEFNGRLVNSQSDLLGYLLESKVGEKVLVKVIRNGKSRNFNLNINQKPQTKAYLSRKGISGISIKDDLKGVLVSKVDTGSIAYLNGLRSGDLIREIDKKRVGSSADFWKYVNSSDKSYIVKVYRGDGYFLLSLGK